ncbi:MAG: 2-oxo acid dehydrogenase subunit E2 [Eubacterium sp.]|nr:2-oxo acid dehydrogenase subunit E2 [Eubacterium sp.]
MRRRFGDRRDGRVIRNIDSMHYIMPLMVPKRCDNEAYMTLRKEMELSLTIDERIADGYYYGKTMKLLKKLMENPELLELPLAKNVKY